MKSRPTVAIATGFLIYVILISVYYLSGQGSYSDGIHKERWAEAISGLLAWFVPALIAGSITRARPIIVGWVLGLLIITFDIAATTLVFGWDWVIATFRIFPASQFFLVLSAMAFSYAGWKIQEISVQTKR